MTEDEHVYLSTACHHELHSECRKQCKFCSVDCVCDCHVENDATLLSNITDKLDGMVEQYAAILESYQAIQQNYAGVANDVEKIKTALNIDVSPPGE
jgi:hypothetical protein